MEFRTNVATARFCVPAAPYFHPLDHDDEQDAVSKRFWKSTLQPPPLMYLLLTFNVISCTQTTT